MIGTTLILIATDAFQKYQSATGGVLDSNADLLRVTSAQYAKLKNLSFDIGGVCILLWLVSLELLIHTSLLFNQTTFHLTPNAQIWPRNLNSQLGGTAGDIYLVVADIGNASGSGLDFINGQSFLERFYSVFDTANQRVGLATTSFTTATTNWDTRADEIFLIYEIIYFRNETLGSPP